MQDTPPVQYPTRGRTTNTNTPLTRDQVMRLKATNFEKSIKRDKTQDNETKDERSFYMWECSFMTTAGSQQIQDVLNPEFIPIGNSETDLFNKKKECTFSVIDHVLKTSDGKALLRKHYTHTMLRLIPLTQKFAIFEKFMFNNLGCPLRSTRIR
jgi:hypothetical protein